MGVLLGRDRCPLSLNAVKSHYKEGTYFAANLTLYYAGKLEDFFYQGINDNAQRRVLRLSQMKSP